MKQKVAVVLMNLGGPDSLKAVRPFLYNLFNDPAIISLPFPFRPLLAGLISTLRAKKAQKIYEMLGGKSPLLENTQAQAQALKNVLSEKLANKEIGVFIAMRYWHPFTFETLKEVEAFEPDEVILLPLYPQFSTTTTASSLRLWHQLSQQKPWKLYDICCYPVLEGFTQAYKELICEALAKYEDPSQVKLLFSAHGLPQKVVDQGDPYADHVKKSVDLIMAELVPGKITYEICYQSRVGPLQWLTPSLEEALKQAAIEQKKVIVVPISFVSEHSETLVELDIEYREKSQQWGVVSYERLPTVSTHPTFIKGIAEMVINLLKTQSMPKICASSFAKCWCKNDK